MLPRPGSSRTSPPAAETPRQVGAGTSLRRAPAGTVRPTGASTAFLARAAIVAAIYVALTLALSPISYLQVQVRVSEALTALAFLEPAAIPGLFVGAFIANLFGPLGLLDAALGSLYTLLAAYLTWRIRRPALALIPPVVINAFGVAFTLWLVYRLPYWLSVLTVGAGEAVAVYALGLPLLLVLLRTGALIRPEVLEGKLKSLKSG